MTEGEPTLGERVARGTLRMAVVLCLLAAAVLLAADAQEYPGWSRAGIRALLRNIVPLAGVAVLNLHLLDRPSPPRIRFLAVMAADILLLVIAVRMLLPSGGPPLPWMLAATALLLLLGAFGVLRYRRVA